MKHANTSSYEQKHINMASARKKSDVWELWGTVTAAGRKVAEYCKEERN
jgi:hypothetical protein